MLPHRFDVAGLSGRAGANAAGFFEQVDRCRVGIDLAAAATNDARNVLVVKDALSSGHRQQFLHGLAAHFEFLLFALNLDRVVAVHDPHPKRIAEPAEVSVLSPEQRTNQIGVSDRYGGGRHALR